MSKSKTLLLHATPSAVRQARVFTAINLRRWGAIGFIEDALLIVSELVTNAVNASTDRDEVSVWVATDGVSVHIEVRDRAPGIPLVFDPALDHETGRGMFVVATLSKEWGCSPAASGGKFVWAKLA